MVAIVAAALPVAACGGTKTVDRTTLEKKVKAIVEQRDETDATVTCPSGVKGQTGVTFTCSVSEKNPQPTTYKVPGTMTDGNGHFTVVVHGNTFPDTYSG
jgi:hypothetical protein